MKKLKEYKQDKKAAHLQESKAKNACFFMRLVTKQSALLNCFLMGSSSSLNPISSFIFILSKRVCFFVNSCPRQYLAAFSLNSCLLCLSIGVSQYSGASQSYPQCFSHLATVLITEFFASNFGGVRQASLLSLSRSLLRCRSELWILYVFI